ncbi:hypothetical protein BUZ69_11885 [Staphylococcus saprophyticus]|uniref:hypothetical protein n=1 Tax=Staphylococcus saprophyticus TaxID=29385 RepID=UPI000D1EFA00|nr:hypothetical protein [Staphylococcus saprophyticus]PTK45059.1 hypothetical protein BUZ69_11885 [Staphylococcus saprophyticus]
MDRRKKRAEMIGVIILIVCLITNLILIYLEMKTHDNKYVWFGFLVLIIGMASYIGAKIYGAKQRHIEKINEILKELKLTDEEIEKRQTYLTNQSVSKLVDLEKILYRELKQNREPKQKYMSDKEFFEPLLKKKDGLQLEKDKTYSIRRMRKLSKKIEEAKKNSRE